MFENINKTYFLGLFLGFILFYCYQVLIRGPKDAARDTRVSEYIDRLSADGRTRIEQTLAQKDKIGAIKIFREETSVGLSEAKECIDFIIREVKQKK